MNKPAGHRTRATNATHAAPTARRTAAIGRRRLPAWLAIVALALTVSLAGCGVRLETPPPAEPVPTAFEQVRRTAVSDALRVVDLANAAAQYPGISASTQAQLQEVIDFSMEHVYALGGVYESGIEPDDDVLVPAPEPPPIEADPAKVVSALGDAAGRNRAAADSIASGELARLLASIGASQLTVATSLASVAAVPPPVTTIPVVPIVIDQPGDATASPYPTADGEQAGPPDDGTEPTHHDVEVAVIVPGESEAVAPSGLTVSDFNALILGDDAARFALEVRAAKVAGEHRSRLLERSAIHGTRALAWAHLAGFVGSQQDPRLGVYSVPRETYNLTLSGDALAAARAAFDAGLIRDLQAALSINFASAVGIAAPTTRAVLIELLAEADLTRLEWGGAPVAFPGLPELAEPPAVPAD